MVEKRLYIVVPAKLYVPETCKTIDMPCGRLMAQAVHVGSKIKIYQRLDPDLETTTIILKVCHSKELELILEKVKESGQPWEVFLDDNKEVYGTDAKLLTAVACLCSRKKGKSLFYGVPSWKCDAEHRVG